MLRSCRPCDLPEIFLARDALHAGLLTASQLRGPLVARVLHGVYRPAWVCDTHALRCRAAALILPRGSVITGRSAATVQGLELAQAHDDIEIRVLLGAGLSQRQGLSIRTSTRAPAVRWFGTVPLADPFTMAFDLAARKPTAVGTSYLDAAIRENLFHRPRFAEWLGKVRDRDLNQVRACESLIDARSRSLPESILRVQLVQAGYAVEPYFTIRNEDGPDLIAKLALPRQKLVLEFLAAHCASAELSEREHFRQQLQRLGWELLLITPAQLKSPRGLPALINAMVHQGPVARR